MSEPEGKIFQVQYQDKNAVYNCYMSFTKEGGLFVPSSQIMKMGDSIFLMVKLPDVPESFFISARVAWLSTGHKKGFGACFLADESANRIRNAIENMLASSIKSATPTYTL